ncbi:hypothetical protein KZ829_00355 [Actinoplanes hulinensis]|uniref:Uncharacterized protein n=1 Tax=Actinoplanes hulinensis TaxID=1144547 RepID=A0ABS7ATR7_9ACTN|nr:hypothetical protein [Actinoplanes hulinensis]MBW6432197.1 hypothetical protein [Actinoplanes hulinensis]
MNDVRIRTFEDATRVGAYELSRRWADSVGKVGRTADGEIQELATMAALAHWLTRWLPTQTHRAALAGADRVTIAAALGVTVEEAAARWSEWARGQRDLYEATGRDGKTPIGISAGECAQVAAVLGIPGRRP